MTEWQRSPFVVIGVAIAAVSGLLLTIFGGTDHYFGFSSGTDGQSWGAALLAAAVGFALYAELTLRNHQQ